MTELDTKDRCGVWPLCTGDSDPFIECCAWHDRAYTKGSWHQQNMTRKQVDEYFLKLMLREAGDCPGLKFRAYGYYKFARWFGGSLWEGI